MYFKIKNTIMFRKYSNYGYITDNAMFGYRFLNDQSIWPGERYVSESGAVMLDQLSKEPKSIDAIIADLLDIFIDVDVIELKNDVTEFYMQFVMDGFLTCGETAAQCIENDKNAESYDITQEKCQSSAQVVDCSRNLFNQSDFLRSIHIEIASECNERCVHCYIPHEKKTQTININLLHKILEQGRASNIINVTLSGGEPLLHKDIISILGKCRELDLSVNLLSNLTLLNDDIILEMTKNPLLSVQTSIYSMDAKIHDFITKVNGSFEKTKTNLLKLCSLGIPVQISCPIMKQNKDTFMDVVDWGNSHNIGVSTDYVIFAAYDHSNTNLCNRLTLEEISTAVDKQLSDDYADALCKIAEEKKTLTSESPICPICRYNFCVSAEGKVFPCVGWQTNIIDDLNEKTVKEIWETSKAIDTLRKIKRKNFPKCVSCNDRGYCTVCMMSNSNETSDGNAFVVDEYHCKVASIIHKKVEDYSMNLKKY